MAYPYPHPLVSGEEAVYYTLTMEESFGGTTYPTTGEHNYLEGSNVTLVATPLEDYEFLDWEIDGANQTATATWYVEMDGDYTAKAWFSYTGEEEPEPTPPPTPTPSPTPTPTPAPTLPPVPYGTYTLYFRSDLYTVYETTGYGLDTTNTDETATVTQTSATAPTSYGYRIYLLDSSGYTHELTSGTPVATVTRYTDGEGYQNNTYAMSSVHVTGAESVLIQVCMKVGSGEWTAKANFVSNPILTDEIEASTWYFSLYTNLTGTTATFSYGSDSAASMVIGLSFSEPSMWSTAMFYFRTGDYLMFVAYPYARLIGMSPFVSIIIFGVGLSVYIRFRSFAFLLLVLTMLSVGGILQFIMGDALMGIVALACVFALASLYWKVFR